MVFDKERGYFHRGWKKPERAIDPALLKNYLPLDKIHALQLISERVSGNKSSYLSYELNLVDVDGGRVNVVDHGHLRGIEEDARMLAEFLGKPLWNGI